MSLPNLAKMSTTIDTGNDEYYQTREAYNEYSHVRGYTTAALKRLHILGYNQAMSDEEWEAFQAYGMSNAFFQPFWRKQSLINRPERDIQALSQSMMVKFKHDNQAKSILNWNVLNATARQLEDVDFERLSLAEETLYKLYQYLEPHMPQLENRYMFISTIGGGLMLHFYCQNKEEQKFSATVFLMCDQHVFNKSSSITFDWHKVTRNSNNTMLRNELYKLIKQAQKPEIQELLFPHLYENNEEHNPTHEQFALTQQLHIDVHQVEALFQKYVQQGISTHQCIPLAIEQQFIENNTNIVPMDNSCNNALNNDVKDLYSLFKDIFYHFHDDSGRLAFKPNQFKLIEYPRHRFTDKPHVAHFGVLAYISAEQTWGVAEKMIFDCADKWAINGNDVHIVRQAFNELKALYPNDTAIHRVENHDFSQDECLWTCLST